MFDKTNLYFKEAIDMGYTKLEFPTIDELRSKHKQG